MYFLSAQLFLVISCVIFTSRSSNAFTTVLKMTSANGTPLYKKNLSSSSSTKNSVSTSASAIAASSTIISNSQQRSSNTVIFYKQLDDHEVETTAGALFDASALSIPEQQQQQQQQQQTRFQPQQSLSQGIGMELPLIELPRSVFQQVSQERFQEENQILLDVEMFVGRVAIVMAFYLFTRELLHLTSGSILLDKFQ